MTLKQERIRIAKFHGFKVVETPDYWWIVGPEGNHISGHGRGVNGRKPKIGEEDMWYLPVYRYDLNAVHEVEKVLRSKGENIWNSYLHNLCEAVIAMKMPKQRDIPARDVVSATARQRVQALIKTLDEHPKI